MSVPNFKVSKVQISLDGKVCEVEWKDGHLSRYNVKWLRFNCQCKRCKPDLCATCTVDVPRYTDDFRMVEAKISEDGDSLAIKYNGDAVLDHVGVLSLEWLRSSCYCDLCLSELVESRDVITKSMSRSKTEIPSVEYSELKDNDSGLFKMLELFFEFGFCRVRNVPRNDRMIIEFGSKIGFIRTATTSGDLFNVFPHFTDNVAFTDKELLPHMDQQIYEYTPGIQIIHALRFDSEVTGGDSQIVDMFEVAETLRKENPEDFEVLTRIPATFTKINYNWKVVGVNWHPGFLSTPIVRENDVEKYYKAHRKFALIVERDDLAGKYKFRMQPGDLLVVNNRRMCHARTSFQLNGGWRHLQACFVNLDDVKSTYMILAKKLGIKVIPPKVGNTSSI